MMTSPSIRLSIDHSADVPVTLNFTHGKITESTKASDDTLGAVLDELAQDSGLLPPAVRWISQTGRFCIFERPPHEVTISFYGVELAKTRKAREQRFTIALPWTVYAVAVDLSNRIAEVSLFARSTPIRTVHDRLYLLPLPNLYADGKFCLRPHTEGGGSLADALVRAYNEVWHSDFNLDVIRTVEAAFSYRQPAELFADVPNPVRPSAASLLAHWEKFSVAKVTTWEHWVPVIGWHFDDEDEPEFDDNGDPIEREPQMFGVSHLIDHLIQLDAEYYGSPTFFMNTLRTSLRTRTSA